MSARDRRLAAELASKRGSAYESASDRARRKESARRDVPSWEVIAAATSVATTDASRKRRTAHRARTHREPSVPGLRSITQWFRS